MERSHYNIDKVISHYLSGQISEQERAYLHAWLSESDGNKEILKNLEFAWNQESEKRSSQNHNEEEIARSIWQKVQKNQESTYKFKVSYLQSAAAILLIIIAASVVFIDEVAFRTSNEQVATIAEVIKQNPHGQKSQIMLPDGSKVWLNSGSILTFPERFDDSVRLVKLSGEAFFDVAKDTLRPFTVLSGKISTTALGTSFNVSAYDSSSVQVSLLTGIVKVNNISYNNDSSIVLKPGYAVSYLDSDHGNVFQFNQENVMAWKNGILLFENDDFDEFVRKIERWYGVNVEVIGTKPANWDFNARYSNTYLKEILNHISYSKNIKYELDEKNLTLWTEK
ncbi:MAG: FecR family protein [Candidatus Cyclobacteriaceae bacterium M3_2C_046]